MKIKGVSVLIGILMLVGCTANQARQQTSSGQVASKDTTTGLWKAADLAYQQQDWRQSYRLYNEISEDVNDADVEFRKGVSAFRLQRIKIAEESFEKAVKLNPSYKKALFNLAMINMSRGYVYLNRYVEALPVDQQPQELKDILKTLDDFSQQ